MRLLVVGEKSKPENRVVSPLNPERKPMRDDWSMAPRRELGPHDGLPDKVRAARAAGLRPEQRSEIGHQKIR